MKFLTKNFAAAGAFVVGSVACGIALNQIFGDTTELCHVGDRVGVHSTGLTGNGVILFEAGQKVFHSENALGTEDVIEISSGFCIGGGLPDVQQNVEWSSIPYFSASTMVCRSTTKPEIAAVVNTFWNSSDYRLYGAEGEEFDSFDGFSVKHAAREIALNHCEQ